MKNIFRFSAFLLAGIIGCQIIGSGQPWMPEPVTNPIRLDDIISQYRQTHPVPARAQTPISDEPMDEGAEYQFDRWAWYWRQHLDEQGYMVSPIKTADEWNKYLELHKIQAKTSGSTSSAMSNWTFQGPDHTPGGYNGIGRINCVAFHPTDPHTYYIGSAGGGVWKTTDGGNSWASLYSSMPTMGVSDMVVNPLNPNTVYVCTGDKDGHDNFSIGVIKSTDGGVTWTTTPLGWTVNSFHFARSILINPLDTNSLTLATDLGIYKSYDGAATWHFVVAGDYQQILYNPTDTNKVYGTTGGTYVQIQRSVDGGITWTSAINFTDADRVNIAVTVANTNEVMAIASNLNNGLEGIYASLDEGSSYSAVYKGNSACTNNLLGWDLNMPSTGCTGQGWYDLCIAIDPTDANFVIIGGVNHYYSTDGGVTWQIATQWFSGLPDVGTVHADKHWLGYNPLNNYLYATCDGGVYSTLSVTSSIWTDHTNGIGVTEFYRIATANGVPFCIGGSQDNGTKMVNAGTYTDLLGGDGMQCQVDYDDPYNTWYGSTPNGNIQMTSSAGSFWQTISTAIPDAVTGDWVTPFIIHPTNSNELLVGYDILWHSSDYGSSWTAVSPQFSPVYKINDIEVPFANPNYIYIVLDDNSIRFSPDFGTTWDILPGNGSSAIISRVVADPVNADLIWVTFNGYTASRKVASYNRTTNHWTNFTGTLPNIPVNCILIDSTTQTKYIGTETTVFYRDTSMTDWALYNINLPTVIVNDLKINYSSGFLWAGTYGRGIWETKKADFPSGVANIVTPAAIHAFPNPVSGLFSVDNAGGNNYQLINAYGMVVATGSLTSMHESIDMSRMDDGVYELILQDPVSLAGRQTIKLVKVAQ